MEEIREIVQLIIEDDDDDDNMLLQMILNEQNMHAGEDGPESLNSNLNVHGWRVLGDPTFKTHFRMDRTTFDRLVVAVGLQQEMGGMKIENAVTPLDLSIMIGLWILCNGDVFRSAAVKFGVTKGVVHFHYKRLVRPLSAMAGNYIAWPDERERDIIQHAFERRYEYPGVVGAIDGTHIYVTAPLHQPQAYVNRHHTYSILAQCVCDHRMLFRDVYVGEPGSVGDARMFSRSPLRENLYARQNMLRDTEHVLADSAYPLTDKTITPYPHDTQDLMERHHNHIFSKCRSIVERSFALLKNKFSRIRHFRSRSLQIGIWHIMSCLVLHNFIILKEIELRPGREAMDCAGGHPIADDEWERSRELGAIKREYIANLLDNNNNN